MTKYVLEFFEKGESEPTFRELGSLKDGERPILTKSCFNGSIDRSFVQNEIYKVRIRYESNMSLAGEAKMVNGVGRIKWFRRIK